MNILPFAGVLLLVLGIASFVLPIPRTQTVGIKVGNTNLGVQAGHSERVSPTICIVLITGGSALSIADARKKD
jgi:hypothetical protein